MNAWAGIAAREVFIEILARRVVCLVAELAERAVVTLRTVALTIDAR